VIPDRKEGMRNPGFFPTEIFDAQRRRYSLDVRVHPLLWILRITEAGKPGIVGYMNCVPEGAVLRLMDICIENDFRGCGLGSLLIKILVAAARNKFQRIQGEIKQSGLDEWAQLPDWYVAQGFSVDRSKVPMRFVLHLTAN
jgi:ribosomal protein S18 acetylase RimI-like enzyme